MSSSDSRQALHKAGIVREILTNTRLLMLLTCSGLFLLGMMYLTIWGEQGLVTVQAKQQETVRMIREIEALEHENARLSRDIQRLRDDKAYIERIAREELGLVRPGELVFEFVE